MFIGRITFRRAYDPAHLRHIMSNQDKRNFETAGESFRVSSRPVVSSRVSAEDSRENRGSGAGEGIGELPRSYAQPVVFAIARDPESLFVYWDIDWVQAFADGAPAERKVYLRVYGDDSSEVNRMRIEPLGQSCDVRGLQPRSSFRIDIGYFDHDQSWNSVGTSDVVTTPPDKIGTLAPGDFALVPFHMTFQRLTELFRKTTRGEGSLTGSLARLQEKVANDHSSLTAEEYEIFRAMKASTSERISAPRVELDRASEMRLQKKLESILGFGATSPKGPFGGSSGGV